MQQRIYTGSCPTAFLQSTKQRLVEQFIEENRTISVDSDINGLYLVLDTIYAVITMQIRRDYGNIMFVTATQQVDEQKLFLQPKISVLHIYSQLLLISKTMYNSQESCDILEVAKLVNPVLFQNVNSFQELTVDKQVLYQTILNSVINSLYKNPDQEIDVQLIQSINNFIMKKNQLKLILNNVNQQIYQQYFSHSVFIRNKNEIDIFQTFAIVTFLLNCFQIKTTPLNSLEKGSIGKFMNYSKFIDGGDEWQNCGQKWNRAEEIQLVFPAFIQQSQDNYVKCVYTAKAVINISSLNNFNWDLKYSKNCQNLQSNLIGESSVGNNMYMQEFNQQQATKQLEQRQQLTNKLDENEQLLRQSREMAQHIQTLNQQQKQILNQMKNEQQVLSVDEQLLELNNDYYKKFKQYDIFKQQQKPSYVMFLEQKLQSQGCSDILETLQQKQHNNEVLEQQNLCNTDEKENIQHFNIEQQVEQSQSTVK